MALQWKWTDKMGKAIISQNERKYEIGIYGGNALAIFISEDKDSYQLYKAVAAFNRDRHNLRWQTKQSKAFTDAYKGSGAYFTMKNLILFHGARFNGCTTAKQSLARMENLASNLEGWELLGAMKQLIKDSGISVEKKIAEWKKQPATKK
jgi:hypothetical protein